MSPEDIERYVARLQEMKMRRRPAVPSSKPDSLMTLTTKCIHENASQFLTFDTVFKGHSNNPFACLPKGLAKQLIEKPGLFKLLPNKADRLCLVLQLLNPQLTEYSKLREDMSAEWHVTIFRHLLQNCPKIQKIEVTNHSLMDFVVLPRSRHVDIIQMMGQQWPNLTYLKMSKVHQDHKINSNVLFEMISRHLPGLSGLDIVISLKTLTMKGVRYLSQMSKLKYLGLDFNDYNDVKNLLIVVHAVGELPLINKFDIINKNTLANIDFGHFVDAYGQLYPRKRLTLKSLSLAHDLENPWPECLTLEKLSIKDDTFQKTNSKTGRASLNKFRNLLAGKCFPTRVSIRKVESAAIYPLLEKFGPAGLVDLKIQAEYNNEPLDVCRLLAACPKLQTIKIYNCEFTETSNFKVTPDQFKDLKIFDISINEDINDRRKSLLQVSQLFRNYLIGSRKFLKVLTLKETVELDDVLWALDQEKRTCLDQIEEVVFDSDSFRYLEAEDDEIKEKALLVVIQLALRSSNLKKVEMQYMLDDQILPKWYQSAFQDLGITLLLSDGEDSDESSDDDDESNSDSEQNSDADNIF